MTADTFALTQFDAMHQAIIAAHSVDEVKDIRDRAEALRQYAKQSRMGVEDINRVTEIKLRAERRGGQLLAELERGQRGNPTGSNQYVERNSCQPGTNSSEYAAVLEENGIARRTAHRWQEIAAIPAPVFEQHIATMVDAGDELTTAFMLRKAQEHKRELKREAMAAPGAFPPGKYRVIYADPPWQMNDSGVKTASDNYGVADRHYPTMPTQQIAMLEVQGRPFQDLCATESVLFLWATAPMLPEGLAVMTAWGFIYKTNFVWDKQSHVFGHYSSVRHEHLLLGTRGSCLPDIDQKLPSVVVAERGEHSEKPKAFREMIDRLYPHGPRIELFARSQTPGWISWGNEANV